MAIYAEHEKLKALGGANNTVGDFIGWLSEQGYVIAEYVGNRDFPWPISKGRDQLIAEFFEIDPNKLEEEKRAMLDSLAAGRGGE